MATKASIAKMKYDKTHVKQYPLRMNLVYDADVIEKLSSVPNVQGYIKQLIREDIARTHSTRIALFADHVADITTLSDEMYIEKEEQ